jgi:beta-N-acetylhexosaminidase
MKKIIASFILLRLLLPGFLFSQKCEPPFLKYLNHPWVDSVLKTLSTEEKIAQLIWVAGGGDNNISSDVELSNLIKNTGVGGVIFFEGQTVRQVEMINYFKRISKVPVVIAIDGEWGAGMRLQEITRFPYQMTLGAIQDDSLIFKMGTAVAKQFRRGGIDINLAPVADVDNNPANPVINFRSFGEDPQNVGRKTLMYMKGMQDNGIFAVAKHFPGHGDTDVDSHLDLPVINKTKSKLDSLELVPFRTLINNGICGVMPGHLSVPALDTVRNLPATLSYNILTKLLRNELEFKGLTLSDAMQMGGITRYSVPGDAEFRSLKAGMDVLEYVTDPLIAIKTISEKIKKKEISEELITEKCRKVLAAKYWAGLDKPVSIPLKGLVEEMSPSETDALIRDLYANALTLINNKNSVIPLMHIDSLKIATLAIKSRSVTDFQKRISNYMPVTNFIIDSLNSKKAGLLLRDLKGYDVVIAGIFNTEQKALTNFGIPDGLNEFLDSLNSQNKTILTYFGNPYALARIKAAENCAGLLVAYQDNSFTHDLSAQLIFGGIGAKGKLPVTINEKYPAGSGIITQGNIRLQYGLPENAGMNSGRLIGQIDSIVNAGLTAKAFPGCEIMVARKGVVVYHKEYGFQTYENRIKVEEGDLFDLASVSKVSGALPGLMLLNSQGKFSPDEKLGTYLPYFRRSDKGDIYLRDFLTHQAGLVAWLPFWKETQRKDGSFKRNTFSHEQSEKYPLKVADNLYINKNYRAKMFKEIKKSPLGPKKYKYSDLTFIISPEIINTLSGKPWYEFVTNEIYHKIGAYDIGFNPYLKYPLSRIVPTEYDSLFRKQLIHGTVHDEGAAMLGGISGHAGLFASANDEMKLMELYRRMGSYGGEQLISSKVLEEYSRIQFPDNGNYRGLGFDKPNLLNASAKKEDIYPTWGASPESFGHSGFTGTFVWVDPKAEISYVFFCNRVYPTRNNSLLSTMNIRTSILQAIYDSIEDKR